jgi:hypothetical protein
MSRDKRRKTSARMLQLIWFGSGRVFFLSFHARNELQFHVLHAAIPACLYSKCFSSSPKSPRTARASSTASPRTRLYHSSLFLLLIHCIIPRSLTWTTHFDFTTTHSSRSHLTKTKICQDSHQRKHWGLLSY